MAIIIITSIHLVENGYHKFCIAWTVFFGDISKEAEMHCGQSSIV